MTGTAALEPGLRAMTPVSREKVVVTVRGRQSPGALAEVMRVLGPSRLVDFGQLVLRDRFTATAVIAVSHQSDSADTFKDIIFRAHASGFQVDFEATSSVRPAAENSLTLASANSLASLASATSSMSLASSSAAANTAATEEYIVTLFSPRRIPARFVADATRIIADHGANIASINRLTDDSEDDYMCLELRVSVARDDDSVAALRKDLFHLGRALNSPDIAVQQARITRTAKRIVVFDLSFTLVRCDAVDVLLEAAGVSVPEAELAANKAGELTGADWLRARAAALKGADADEVNAKTHEKLSYTDGGKELVKGLKRLGCRLAVVSSGSRKIAEYAKETLGLHLAYGNVFEVDSRNRFTGVVSVRYHLLRFCLHKSSRQNILLSHDV
jgi:predicted amino acid-binding ACT domain protein